jgi:hypothetical protein
MLEGDYAPGRTTLPDLSKGARQDKRSVWSFRFGVGRAAIHPIADKFTVTKPP